MKKKCLKTKVLEVINNQIYEWKIYENIWSDAGKLFLLSTTNLIDVIGRKIKTFIEKIEIEKGIINIST